MPCEIKKDGELIATLGNSNEERILWGEPNIEIKWGGDYIPTLIIKSGKTVKMDLLDREGKKMEFHTQQKVNYLGRKVYLITQLEATRV